MKSLRKIFACSLSMILILSGCASQETNETADAPQEKEAVTEQTDENINADDTETDAAEGQGKYLVIYFSRTGEQYNVGTIDKGNTEIVAEMIAENTGADLFEILPEDDRYPVTYAELTEVAKKEQSEHASIPFRGELPDLHQYEAVFVGSPVWWGDWPMIMYTLFETNDFSGITLIPFNTNEGSGKSGFDKKLKNVCPDAEVLDMLAISGHDAQNNRESTAQKVSEWLNQLGYKK